MTYCELSVGHSFLCKHGLSGCAGFTDNYVTCNSGHYGRSSPRIVLAALAEVLEYLDFVGIR